MEKRTKGHCKRCGVYYGEENLSKQKLCYACAKSRMLKAFDMMWSFKHKK